MIRQRNKNDFDSIYEIINDSAQLYKGVIPIRELSLRTAGKNLTCRGMNCVIRSKTALYSGGMKKTTNFPELWAFSMYRM